MATPTPTATPTLPALASRTAIIVAASAALGVGAATALAWWALTPSGSGGTLRGPFDFSRDTIPDVPDSALVLLARCRAANKLRDADNPRALRAHLFRWWTSVKRRVHVYRCIQEMMFLQPRINQHPLYKDILQRATQGPAEDRRSLRVADVGCCFGQDPQLMVLEGVAAGSIWAIDLIPDYWEASKELWGDTEGGRMSGVHTLFGDMTAVPKTPSAVDLERHQLLGTFHFVSTMAVLHCLAQDRVERFLSRCLSMLLPGSGVLLGMCMGTQELEGATWAAVQAGPLGEEAVHTRFLHSKATLQQTLEALGYTDVEVREVERQFKRAEQEPGSTAGSTPSMVALYFQARRP